MYINEYHYLKPTEKHAEYNGVADINREDYISQQYIDKIPDIVLTKPTAVLYAGGFTLSENESRGVEKVNSRFHGEIPFNSTSILLRESTNFCLHRWIGSMVNNELVVHASINSNTCASSMYSLYDAARLLNNNECEEVIIISEGRVSFNTLRLFKEHRIPLVVGDGLAVIRLTKEGVGHYIDSTKWSYQYDRNPFMTTVSGYDKVLTKGCSIVKPHGTGTASNNIAEAELVKDTKVLYYKQDTGHTLSVSALLEVCLTLDDDSIRNESVLCIASGLGGFYGSCVLHKV